MWFPLQVIGDELIDSIISDNIPILAEQAKYNEAVYSSTNRLEVGPPPSDPVLCVR